VDPRGKPRPLTWLQSFVALALTLAPLLFWYCLCMQGSLLDHGKVDLLLAPICRDLASRGPFTRWETIHDST
jgi:hypothetical protein